MGDLDLRTISYRLWRLRRLIAVAALLPLPGILFAGLFGFGLTYGGGGGILWFLWILAVFALAVRFPNGWIDLFALGLPLAAIIFLSPIARLFGIGPFSGTLLGLVTMAAGWFWINGKLPAMLDDIPMGTQKNTFRARVALPAKTLREALFLRPGARCGLHACGAAGADGIFQVKSFGYQLLDDTFTPTEGEIAFLARVVETGETTQITQYFLAEDSLTASTTYEEVTPTRRGCSYAKEEVHDHFSVLAAIGFWLNDVEADHLTATLDFLNEQPPRALKLMPQDSLLTWTAQQVIERMAGDTGDAA